MSNHKDVHNFGVQEANRMALTRPDPWANLEAWLRTTTGSEFCDELVWGTVGSETLDALLRGEGITPNPESRSKLVKLADRLMTSGEA